MFRILFLVVLIFPNLAQSKQSLIEKQDLLMAELSTTLEEINTESIEWDRTFYQSLIDDEDPNIQLLGYSKIISGLDEKHSLIYISTEINSMITSEILNHKSIATIATICNFQKLKPLCNHDAIFEKQRQTMPDNAFIYLSNLNLAYEDANQEAIKQAITDISQSTYIDTFMYLHEAFRIKFEKYVKANPFPKNKQALEKLWITKYSKSNCDDSNSLEENPANLEDVMIFTKLVGFKLAEPIPAFRSLMQVCKDNVAYEKSCLKISELLINKSKTIISAIIGHALKIEILKQHDNSKELKQAENSKKEYKDRYECLAKVMNYGSSYFSRRGYEFSKIADPIERAFGEVAFFESLAKLNYDYYFNLGDANIINPDSCNNPIQ